MLTDNEQRIKAIAERDEFITPGTALHLLNTVEQLRGANERLQSRVAALEAERAETSDTDVLILDGRFFPVWRTSPKAATSSADSAATVTVEGNGE